MIGSAVGRRYGRALFESAAHAGEVDAVEADLAALVALLAGEPSLRRFIASPRVTEDEKKALFEGQLGPRVRPLTLSMLQLLVEKRRLGAFAEIVSAYQGMVRESRGVVEARVITARPLETATGEAIRKQLERITGKQVTVVQELDPGLLGGVKVMIGEKVIDGSVAFQMNRLREALLAVRVH